MLHFSTKMLDNTHHVEAFLLILTLKKQNVKKQRIQVNGFYAYT